MKYLVPVLLTISLGVCPITSHKIRNILVNEFQPKSKSLDDINVWRNKLKDDFRQTLHKLPDTIKTAIIAKADDVMKTNWEPLLATVYLEFKTKGERYHFEGKNFNRRKRLEALVLAEILTEKGKYVNDIANGVWLLMEESSWTWPAHLGMQKSGLGLPDPDQIVIDLGAGETSAYVAWLQLLMGEELDKISKMFVKRIDYELNRRIVQSFLQNDFKNWMGLEGQDVGNWNIWINTNLLMTTLLSVNQTQRMEVLNKIIKSADDWLNSYGDDGGCDEGPSYWYEAGGRFIQFIYFLSSASNHQMNWSKNALIDNIGSYIYKMHIDGKYFVNFADAEPKQTPDPSLIYRYGQLFNNTKMLGFAAYVYQILGNDSYIVKDSFSGNLHLYYLEMSAFNSLKTIVPKAPQPIESWFPDIQVVTLRSEEGSPKGLFIGAKGGTNGENHNHNDVGNFVLYVNGLPALIDIGTGTYNSKTFSKADRYKVWHYQSQWHNCPTINGVQQYNGRNYAAKNVSYTKTAEGGVFEADIAHAYPREAHVDSWVRKLTLNRSSNILELNESYKMNKFVEPFKIHFITVMNVTHNQDKGRVHLQDQKIKLMMIYDPEVLKVVVDSYKPEDKKIIKNWGTLVYRVTLLSKHNDLKGKHLIHFQI